MIQLLAQLKQDLLKLANPKLFKSIDTLSNDILELSTNPNGAPLKEIFNFFFTML